MKIDITIKFFEKKFEKKDFFSMEIPIVNIFWKKKIVSKKFVKKICNKSAPPNQKSAISTEK